MKNYIDKFLLKYGHSHPAKPHLSLHKHNDIFYGAEEQLTPEEDTSPDLDDEDTKRIQGIVGALLYYARDVDNKLLVALSVIGYQQATATNLTQQAASQLLDYCSTYPNDGILYPSSDMIICTHSDDVFHNKSKGCSRSGAHIFISEGKPMPKCNGTVITLVPIIKFVMSSASEGEIGVLFITAK